MDGRHKLNAWVVWQTPLPQHLGTLTLTPMQRLNSGAPYGAIGSVDTRPFVTNPGYATPFASFTYFFTARDAFRTEAAWSTDVALDWQRRVLGRGQLFVQAHLLNVFNNQALSNLTDAACGTGACISTAVLTRVNSGAVRYGLFDPFTQQPVRGTHWDLGPTFGQPLRRFAYQTPRTVRLSLGVRF
jgi:hypothetical protein